MTAKQAHAFGPRSKREIMNQPHQRRPMSYQLSLEQEYEICKGAKSTVQYSVLT